MKRNSPMGQKERTEAKVELGRLLRGWIKLNDQELLAELHKEFPAVSQATRDECLTSLVLYNVERLFKTY